MSERQELCSKCGRGYPLDGDYLPQHNVIKPNGTRQSVVCKGSGEYIAPPVRPAPEKNAKRS